MVISHYHSPYLQRILSTNKKKNDETLSLIKLPNVSPEIFQIILRFYKLTSKEFIDKVLPYIIPLWIDRLDIKDKITSSYEFKLLFRGSRDGLTRDKFHQICDNHSLTLTIVKVKNSNEILGVIIQSNGNLILVLGLLRIVLIFSFDNNRIENFVLSRVVDENYATFNSTLCGSKFDRSDLNI
ncbi:carbohydrate-binding module family 13 protein [Rhizophagus clarus]|uniref:Carbohydrate-binding module family 13 protein n=1 Tax=Rhizophagus clarus TaxID=94130 RepID=A0A8H3KYN4_9GLOM|nr:carbohydrate-binding module family 13 protein [Rhizophagus clarus]